jgi:hypothetical protein
LSRYIKGIKPLPSFIPFRQLQTSKLEARPLLERVGVGSPPCKEERKADGLKDTSKSTNSNGIKRTLLSEDLSDELKSN